MKLFVVIACLVAAALAAPKHIPAPPALDSPAVAPGNNLAALRALPALSHQEVHDQYGQYSLRYVTAEGTVVTEHGRLVPTPSGDHVMVTEGEVTWVVDGVTYITSYSAGLDGARITGDHLPTPVTPIGVQYE